MFKYFMIFSFLFLGSLEAQETCFLQSRVHSFKEALDTSVIVETHSKSYVVLVDPCFELEWADRIAFDSFFNQRVCRNDTLLVLDTFTDRVKQRCRIRSVTEL